MTTWMLRPPRIPLELVLEDLIEWCRVARRDGLLGLEIVVSDTRLAAAREAAVRA